MAERVDFGNRGRKSKRPPEWEVEERTQQELGALPNKYDEHEGGCAHAIHNRVIVASKSHLEHIVPPSEAVLSGGER